MPLPYETPAQAEEYRNQLERRFKAINPSNTFESLAEATAYWNSSVEKPWDTQDLYIKDLDQIWTWDSTVADKAVFSRPYYSGAGGSGLALDNTTPYIPEADYHPSTKKYADELILPAIQITESVERVFISQAEKDVIQSLAASSNFKGTYTDLSSLQTAFPTANAGDYADVDAGIGAQVERYIWDASDTEWVIQGSGGGIETAASIKAKYETNPNTEVFTTDEKNKLALQSGTNTGDQDISGIATNASAIALNTAKNSYPSVDAIKLSGIEAGAQVNHTAIEIKNLYESNDDTEVFTTTEKAKVANSITPSDSIVFSGVNSNTASTISPSAGIASWTGLESNFLILTLTEDTTLQNPTTPVNFAVYQFIIQQDASGLWTLSYGSMFKFSNGIAPIIDLNPNSKGILTALFDGTDLLVVSIQNFL